MGVRACSGEREVDDLDRAVDDPRCERAEIGHVPAR
jgi:hypothetical protein